MMCGFHDAWNAPGVTLPVTTLGNAVQHSRNTRNNMQHASAAATVDERYCADAILDAVGVIDHCWPNASANDFRGWMKFALRVVRLYSSQGDVAKRMPFEDAMRDGEWRSDRRQPRTNELIVRAGLRHYWALVMISSHVQVDLLLNSCGIP